MLRVSFHGLRNARYLPLGESCAPAISGLPKSSSRSMMGGRPAVAEAAAGVFLFLVSFASWALRLETSTASEISHNSAFENRFMGGFLSAHKGNGRLLRKGAESAAPFGLKIDH